MIEENKKISSEKTELVCTCNDEFVSPGTPCPVCSAVKDGNKKTFEKTPMIITDNNLTKVVFTTWSGITFHCQKCGQPSIMANEYMGKFCSNCGEPVVLRSKIYTNWLRNEYPKDPI